MTPEQAAWSAVSAAPGAGTALLGGRRDRWAQWARAVCVMATGDYAGAVGSFELLQGGDDEVAGLAAAAIASGLRQLDEHAAAIPFDERAATMPGRAAADGLIGRAADAVGLGQVDEAWGRLAVAHQQVSGWRDIVRWSWVATECALATADSETAARHAGTAMSTALAAGSVRHETKSRLFLGVVRDVIRSGGGTEDLVVAADAAGRHDLRPLVWPAALVLGERATHEQRAAAGSAVRYIGAHLPAGHGQEWAARADVRSLAGA